MFMGRPVEWRGRREKSRGRRGRAMPELVIGDISKLDHRHTVIRVALYVRLTGWERELETGVYVQDEDRGGGL